jgi:RimJ/RimL family protein N-acetyltransferase
MPRLDVRRRAAELNYWVAPVLVVTHIARTTISSLCRLEVVARADGFDVDCAGSEVARFALRRRGPLCMTLVDDVITTPRLMLVSLTPSLLLAVAGGDLVEVERQLGAPVGAGWEEGVPAERRLKQLAADPSEQPWLVRAVLAKTPPRVVGSVGFHSPPDDDGRVEIGYDIVAGERRKGYAREAVQSLLDRAWATGRARTCVAAVSPDNARSLALIRAFGFRRVGEQIDEIDGLEWVFERPLPARDMSGETRSPG